MIEFCRNADRTLTGNGNACSKSAYNEPFVKQLLTCLTRLTGMTSRHSSLKGFFSFAGNPRTSLEDSKDTTSLYRFEEDA